MYNRFAKFLCLILISFFVMNAIYGGEMKGSSPKKGWVTLTGKLVSVEMAKVELVDWTELALKDVRGNLTVLIGEKVAELTDKVDKTVTVTGVYKPSMQVKGKLTPTLEVRYIDKVE